MKSTRPYASFTVTPKAERSIKNGHPWVYGEEITATDGTYEQGAPVDVKSRSGAYLGTGLVNDRSKIRVRIISTNANDRFDDSFFRRRIEYAIAYRRTVIGRQFGACRLIYGDSDSFPGLIIDRFDDVLVAQVLSLGMERLKHRLFPMLIDALRADGERISGIYERNDPPVRALEGLPQGKGEYRMDGCSLAGRTTARIEENGLEYDVDFIEGQKTGYFLDQKDNRAAVARISQGKKVLDCFTHTGSFALNAALGGAAHVAAVDISEKAIEMARRNAALNGLDGKIDFITEDVFDLLTDAPRRNAYDMIILDPPAFTKSRRTVKDATRGYKEINMKAMKLLPRVGYLATCSCSHFMPDELFRKTLADAARDAAVSLRQIYTGTQAPDHPILWGVPETEYLKFYIFQVV